MNTAIVIPARLESTRLSRKLLLQQTGKSLIQHVWEAASTSRLAQRVIVATDSDEIADVVRQFGGDVQMTSVDHKSGSDRVAEVAAGLDADLIVNVQGDEPEMDGTAIDRLIATLAENESVPVGTLATRIRSLQQLLDPACVKVVFDRSGKALYFSRNPIPAPRSEEWVEEYFRDSLQTLASNPLASVPSAAETPVFFQHIGIYAYRREFLLGISQLERSNAEKIESLEQLRFLHHGFPVKVEVIDTAASGIDTAEDYRMFVNRYLNR